MKVLFLTNIPSPYRVDFFAELGRLCDLTVLFEEHASKERDKQWKSDKISQFHAEYLCDKDCLVEHLSNQYYQVIVIGVYSSKIGRRAISYLKRHKRPFVLSTDGGFIKKDNFFKYIVKKYYISAATYWLSSGDITTEYLVHYGAKSDNTYKYPFTSVLKKDILKESMSKSEKRKIREKLGIQEEKIILSVGQFIHRKGYDILLEALSNLDHEIGTYIVGGEPTEEYIKLKEAYGLEHVHFVSFMAKDKLAEYYKAADLFVLPTREDIWGLVINEAMSFGLPVITTNRCVAGCELLSEDIGEIVPVEDVQELSKAMGQWIQEETVSETVLNKIKEYTIEQMAKCHNTIFKEIIHE